LELDADSNFILDSVLSGSSTEPEVALPPVLPVKKRTEDDLHRPKEEWLVKKLRKKGQEY
jgi:hypothetical protein